VNTMPKGDKLIISAHEFWTERLAGSKAIIFTNQLERNDT
jgi:hypothetical protein